jgi:hypothetical protein
MAGVRAGLLRGVHPRPGRKQPRTQVPSLNVTANALVVTWEVVDSRVVSQLAEQTTGPPTSVGRHSPGDCRPGRASAARRCYRSGRGPSGLQLRCLQARWDGLGEGHGHLTGHEITVDVRATGAPPDPPDPHCAFPSRRPTSRATTPPSIQPTPVPLTLVRIERTDCCLSRAPRCQSVWRREQSWIVGLPAARRSRYRPRRSAPSVRPRAHPGSSRRSAVRCAASLGRRSRGRRTTVRWPIRC